MQWEPQGQKATCGYKCPTTERIERVTHILMGASVPAVCFYSMSSDHLILLLKPKLGTHWCYNLIAPLVISLALASVSWLRWQVGLLASTRPGTHFTFFTCPVLFLPPLASHWQGSFCLPVASVAPFLLPGFFLSSFHIHLSKCCHPSSPFLFLPTLDNSRSHEDVKMLLPIW